MPVDPLEFRRVLGHFPAGVTVVTVRGEDGRPYGLTATAFTSVSLDPPLVLVCVDRKSESFPHFERAGAFAVNFLRLDQRETSQRFARSGGDKFADVPYETVATGSPVLRDRLGFLDCTLVHRYEGGDHVIYVGRVEAADAGPGEPLLYYRGAYRRLAEEGDS
ncbi:MAG: hypothetical protein KatS3mg076_2230 [Candidatus Binatia bacterium]|nr:MAG: hypothetical protein KatS3mg076_2230 [Candidatus Binatia bacterium]